MLKVLKATHYQLKGKSEVQKKVHNFTSIAALISGHPVQKSIAIHFHPYNPVLLPQNKEGVLGCP